MVRKIIGLSLAAGMVITASACGPLTVPAAVPVIPLNYYACIETTAEELTRAYTVQYGDPVQAQAMYNGKAFVFKRIRVGQEMLVDGDTFVYHTIRFTAMEPGAVARLKPGEVIDLVRINAGMLPGYLMWLYFTGCVFLPSGSVGLPAQGGDVFRPMY